MGTPTVGDVVVIQFPYSNLKSNKYRPALVIAHSDYGNFVVAQITSKLPLHTTGILLENKDFTTTGNLRSNSYIRTNKLFTAESSIMKLTVGSLGKPKKKEVYAAIKKHLEELKT